MTRTQAGRLYLGWQYATPCPDPGPPPRRPTPPERERIDPSWVAAQRREENLLNRPLKAACGVCAVALAALIVAGLAGWLGVLPAVLGACCAALAAAVSANAIRQRERALRSRVDAEQRRMESLQAESESRLFGWQAEHAALARGWQAHRAAYEQQKRWYAVASPTGVHRIDVVGGTLSGWSAMLVTAAAHRLAEGGAVTVLDLTQAAVALDLVAFATAAGADPQVWVLPADLPRLDVGCGLTGRALADVLSLAVGASEERAPAGDLSVDNAILERIIEVLDAPPTIAAVAAALRVLAQAGQPADDVTAGLITAGQADRLRAMFGRGATDRVIIDRAWAMESRLRKVAAIGTASAPPSGGSLRVIGLSRQAGVLEGTILGAYLAVALTHDLRQTPGPERDAAAGREPGSESASGWRRTLFVLGADSLRGDVLDRLSDACESTGTGLVLACRSISPDVKQRLGRGDAAVVFMRLGNAEDAKAASEQIGTEHRFLLSQLTETIGRSVTDTTAGSYTSTVGRTDSETSSRSTSESASLAAGHTGSRAGGVLPLAQASTSRSLQASESWSAQAAESVSAGITVSTAWGQTTSAAEGTSESLAKVTQRSREFLVEQHELQQLPPSAMIVSYAGPAGRELVLADANPAIGALSTATMHTLEESLAIPPTLLTATATATATAGDAAHDATTDDASTDASTDAVAAEPPNLGPPPPRLDWRRSRS